MAAGNVEWIDSQKGKQKLICDEYLFEVLRAKVVVVFVCRPWYLCRLSTLPIPESA